VAGAAAVLAGAGAIVAAVPWAPWATIGALWAEAWLLLRSVRRLSDGIDVSDLRRR
jgi:hypothetical protein